MARSWLGAVAVLWSCAGVGTVADTSADRADLRAPADHRYVDTELGFEIERPSGEAWRFANGTSAPEGILIPVMVVHGETGAQVVVQIAPNVATAWEFAQRLAVGLSEKQGFETSEPRQIDSTRAEFAFVVEGRVLGRVGVIREENSTFVLLGTWPKDAPGGVAEDVDRIMSSLRPVTVWKRTYAMDPKKPDA